MIPVLYSLSGPRLSDAEAAFFRSVRPAGFILFRRNVGTGDELRALTDSLKDLMGRRDIPILIDQEGGRVQRMAPPHWPAYPAMGLFGAVDRYDPALARRALGLTVAALAEDLRRAGITVNCLPLLDVVHPGADNVIGDRAFGDDPDRVARLGRVVVDALLAGGVLPVVKHVPGHGRATLDSHESLPVVTAPESSLKAVDFRPFRALGDAPFAMTAHVAYTALDGRRPATLSRAIIGRVIRMWMGFGGLLMSDDLSMKALTGPMGARAVAALAAGCDLALHCNGDMAEMEAIAAAVPEAPASLGRALDGAMARARTPAAPVDRAALDAALEACHGLLAEKET
ncbi:beta-N-acetylhexosaminidase [Yunchengibacter salinarum]|uniref:beta-N-acetylhexosaminidase n=1 Tax=Yunchengibacter salinarum TaxID=3133399 RepID=UPI0035B5CB2C